MSRVIVFYMLAVLSMVFPPLLFITVPVFIIWAVSTAERRRAERRVVDPPTIPHYEKARRKALSNF